MYVFKCIKFCLILLNFSNNNYGKLEQYNAIYYNE